MSDEAPEEWRPVVGWEGLYEVSSKSRIRTIGRTILTKDGKTRKVPERIRKIQTRVCGHLSIDLKDEGKRGTYLVHRLVAAAFIPNPHNHPLVRHLNDDPGDNRLENLAWGAKTDNSFDMVRNGLHYWASRIACSRGHTYTEESTRVTSKQRNCRECVRENYGVKEPPNHGTYSGYVTFGCRCEPCRSAGKEYRRVRNAKSKIVSSS